MIIEVPDRGPFRGKRKKQSVAAKIWFYQTSRLNYHRERVKKADVSSVCPSSQRKCGSRLQLSTNINGFCIYTSRFF